jgi:hypothetical protein
MNIEIWFFSLAMAASLVVTVVRFFVAGLLLASHAVWAVW